MSGKMKKSEAISGFQQKIEESNNKFNSLEIKVNKILEEIKDIKKEINK